mgnify:FL=1
MTQYQKNIERVLLSTKKTWTPPPDLTVSEWADQYRTLSPESSAEAGMWKTSRAPYQKGIMDAVNDPKIHTIVFMKSAQVGATEILNNIVAYYIDQDPSPCLVLQPTLQMAQAWSKDRLANMIRDCDRLRAKVKDPRSKDSSNTVLSDHRMQSTAVLCSLVRPTTRSSPHQRLEREGAPAASSLPGP